MRALDVVPGTVAGWRWMHGTRAERWRAARGNVVVGRRSERTRRQGRKQAWRVRADATSRASALHVDPSRCAAGTRHGSGE